MPSLSISRRLAATLAPIFLLAACSDAPDSGPAASETAADATPSIRFTQVEDEVDALCPQVPHELTMPLAIRMPESEYEGSTGRLAEAVVNLVVSPGRQVIGVGLRDEIGGVMSTTTLDLEITKNTG